MVKKILRFAVPGAVAIAAATGVLASQGEKNCNDLVDQSNKIVDVANSASTEAATKALVPKLSTAATDLRSASGDYSSTFAADANQTATALDAIGAAITAGDEKAYGAAVDLLNVGIDKTNKDCDAAR